MTALTGFCLVTSGCPSFRAHAPTDGGVVSDGSNDAAQNDSGVDAATEAPRDAGDGGVHNDAGTEGGQVLAAPVCSSDRWCWQSPLPQGNDLAAVWGTSTNAVWAVGDLGTILLGGTSGWTATPSGTTHPLNGVWGSGPSDAWAVGAAGTIVRWTGASWSSYSSPTTADLNAVWASGPNDAWAVGAQGSILHWNGQWIAQPDPGIFPANVTMVWGASADDVWFAGPTGIIRHMGTTWTAVPNLPDAGVHITALSGNGTDTVVATGADATGSNIYVYVWSATNWGRIYETAGAPLTALVVQSPSAIWAAGASRILNFDGTAWKTQFSAGLNLAGLWLAPGADGWAVGQTGQMVRFDGSAWAEPNPRHVQTLTDVWSSPASAVGDAGVPATDSGSDGADGGKAEAGTPDGASDGGRPDAGLPDRGGPSVWVSGFDPLAAAHHGGVVWRGQDEAWDPVAIGDVGPLWSVWSQTGADVWAAGETLLHGGTSGAPWTPVGATASWRRVRGSSPTSIWSVEDAIHFSNRPMPWPQDGTQLWGLTVFNDYDVWAAAASGRTFHWTTSPVPHWVTFDPATKDPALYSTGGVASDDLWAVGDVGVTRHWDGKQWNDVASGTTQALHGVWAVATGDVWAVGDAGTILHWDGHGWSPSASGTNRRLYAVTGDAAGGLWAVGEQSAILHRSP